MNFQRSIEGKIHFLATNTSSLSVLTNTVIEKNILLPAEVQTINSKPTEYDKYTEFYTTIIKKGDEVFPVLLECLEKSGNQNIANVLQEDPNGITFREKQSDMKSLIWFEVSTPTRFYKGRTEDVATIVKYWNESLVSKNMLFVVITGLGGIGKTELAKYFAKIFHETYGGHCIWINAETNQTILYSFQRLAIALKIPLKDETGNQKTTANFVSDVCNIIRNTKCTFIFDNYESSNAPVLESFINYAKNLPSSELKPFVLVTSRLKLVCQYFETFAAHLELQALSKEASLEFFTESLGVDKNNTTAISDLEDICEKLIHFPLAMQQAVAYIKAMRIDNDIETKIRMYLEEYTKGNKQKVFAYGIPTLLNANYKTIYLTWQVTINKMKNTPGGGSRAKALLNYISFLHPNNINTQFAVKFLESHMSNPVTRLKKKWSTDSNKMAVFDVLFDYSMCKRYTMDGKDVISIHHLVSEVIRLRLEEKCKSMKIIENMLQVVKKMFAEGQVALNDMIHIESLWKHARKMKNLVKQHKKLPDEILLRYADAGRFREALNFISEVSGDLKDSLDEYDRFALRYEWWKGELQYRLGEYTEARTILEKVYLDQKKAFGEDDDHTLQTAKSLGCVCLRERNLAEAMKWMGGALEKREKFFGRENIETRKLMNNLPLVYVDEGKYSEALKIYGELLEVEKQLNGDEHSDVLMTQHNIAYVKMKQGSNAEALDIFKEVAAGRERVLTVDHPDTLRSKYFIARICSSRNENDEALTLATQVLSKQKIVLGHKHPQTLHTEQLVCNLTNTTENV